MDNPFLFINATYDDTIKKVHETLHNVFLIIIHEDEKNYTYYCSISDSNEQYSTKSICADLVYK